MYNVLMPADTSEERTSTQAEYITSLPCAAEEVSVYLLFVYDESDDDIPQNLTDPTRIKAIKEATNILEDAGVGVTVLEDSTDTVDTILQHADENDVDEIVLGGRKRSPTGKALFGSVTQSVILNTSRPVTVTGDTSA